MGDGKEVNETFPDIKIDDLADLAPLVVFRKCGDLKKEAGKPMSRECDDIVGTSMGDCVGPSSRDCSNTIKTWSKLILASFYGILKNNGVADDLKPAQIFFDQTKLTVAGLDNRDGQDAKKATTVANVGKVITELCMRKILTTPD